MISYAHQIKENLMGRACGIYGEKISLREDQDVVFENIIKMDVKEPVWEGVDWFDLADGRDEFRCCCECGREPRVYIKCGEFLD